MKREWITDINKMNFTDEERKTVEKVIDFTDTILYFNGKDYKTEDPSDTYYFTSKDLLMENMNYNYTELEKEGVFDEEDEAPADPWLKVLEDRVAEEKEKADASIQTLKSLAAEFKEWIILAEDYEIIYDLDFKAEQIKEERDCYAAVVHRLHKAKGELADYKETMNL